MSMIDLKNPSISDLLKREKALKPEKHLENYEVEWVYISDDKGGCSNSDKPSDCFVLQGKASKTIKILLQEKNGNGSITIYDQSAPEELLQKLQKPVEPTPEEIAMINLNQAAAELVEDGFPEEAIFNAKLRVAQDISCNCKLDTSVDGMKETILEVIRLKLVFSNNL